MKKDLLEFFSLSPLKTCVIPNPVDIKKIHESIENSPNPYKPGSIHLVSVGRLNYQKGYDLLLKVLKLCLEKVKELHLTIVGEGSEEESLKKMAAELELGDSVSFIGHQDNPYPFMDHADLFISSSRWEGLPNAVLESLACGTPVLAFDCPGGTNEIIVDDKNGWLVPSEDIEAMSGKIVALVRQKKWLKFKNEALLPEKFICENVVKSYEKIIIKSNSDIISRSFAA
jgi:glycosyltransferase involved in cell wall biosynthesis